MPILNYTTKVDSAKTIAQITAILVKHGARKIITDYDESKLPIGVTFYIQLNEQPILFALPCNYEGVLAVMKKDKNITRSLCTKEQALRVSWRILKDWIEAQLAIIEAGLATLPEVMLPYAVTKNGQTLYQRIQGDQTLLLN